LPAGAFTSVAELKDAIFGYLDRHNADPKPFVWTKTAEAILEKERRDLDRLEGIKAGNQASELEHWQFPQVTLRRSRPSTNSAAPNSP
jgi:hypothetical protein